MDEFFDGYVECALWSSDLDDKYNALDIAPETLAKMREDCKQFWEKHGALIESGCGHGDISHAAEFAGHDFWLTRNGHGAGFWDGDWDEPAATILTQASKEFGECDLHVGDDGKIYHA
jgi:hypothetical protein